MPAPGRSALAALAAIVLLAAASPAAGITPGRNGGISFEWSTRGGFGTTLLRPNGVRTPIVLDFASGPVWHPTGTAFATLQHDGWCGSNARGLVRTWPGLTVTNMIDCKSYLPSWAPDGDRLVWTSLAMDVWTTRFAPRRHRRLTGVGRNGEAVWSPDGRTIAFVSHRDGNWELYTMAWDGSGHERLTSTPGQERLPDWSPDSRHLVFLRDGDLWIRTVESGAERRFTTTRDVEPGAVWSPNGNLIAFVRPLRGRDALVAKPVRGGPGRVLARATNLYSPSWRPICTVFGSERAEWLRGTGIRDLVCGRGGDDTAWSGPGNDLVYGGEGNDRLHGGPGDDVLVGGPGRDVLEGGPGRDLLNTRDGRGGDVVRGGPADICRADRRDRVIGC